LIVDRISQIEFSHFYICLKPYALSFKRKLHRD
jgi:hypothetical protein